MKQINHPISRKHTGLRLGLQQVILWAGLGWGIALLGTSSAWAQRVNPQSKGVETKAVIGEGFDPESPGNPGQVYFLTLSVTPQGSGSTYPSQKRISVEPGKQIHCSASPSTGFRFVKWTNQGKTISLQSAFDFTMPSEHVQLVAHFEYDPSSPANPDSVGLKHMVFVTAQPHGAGTFSFTDRVAEQHNYSVSAYPVHGFQFTGWSKQGSTGIVSTESRYEGVMGKEDVHLVAHFKYDPDSPEQHGVNAWDAATGSLVIDYFTPNNLYGAVSKVMNGASRNEVLSFVVAGRMTEGDLSTFSSFPNLQTIDLKRTGGYTAITYGAFRNQGFSSISLPAGIERIEAQAFAGCKNFITLYCYAATPPQLDPDAIDQPLTVHVPEASIPLYKQDSEWSKFTLVPLIDQTFTLEVQLPTEAADGRYKNCRMELVNAKTGQRQRYVISDRVAYTFNGLFENDTYEVIVYSSTGLPLGNLQVTMGKKDQSVKMSQLNTMQDLQLYVLTPEGKDVTQSVGIIWYDADGVYLKRTNRLTQIPTHSQLAYEVSLDRELGVVYRQPVRQTYTVEAESNSLIVRLDSLKRKLVDGQLADEQGKPLAGATVNLTQQLNGTYSVAQTVKTDEQGLWQALLVDSTETTISYQATDFISQQHSLSSLPETSLGLVKLKDLTGAVLTLHYTYAPAFAPGDSTWVEQGYAEADNVDYTLFNRTTGKAITQFSVQYPLIVLLEEVKAGDELIVKATSRNGKFSPIETLVTVRADETATVDLQVKELGSIRAHFTSTDNEAVIAMLYQANGELFRKADYNQAAVTFTDLPDGMYTLVSMANNVYFNSMLRLSQFGTSGLVEGKDYVRHEVKVVSGQIVPVEIATVPQFDAARLSFTGNHTSFTSNKSELTVGNFLTLRATVDFKSVYAQQGISDVKLLVDLPEHAEFVENSVMYGAGQVAYDYENHRLVVPYGPYYNDQVRFCVVPTKQGEFRPSASVEFTLNGQTLVQPLGDAYCAVQDLTVHVPSVTATPQFVVTGIAEPMSEVTVWEGDQPIGLTRVMANGYWNATCELPNPFNLSDYDIYAKVKNRKGFEMTSTVYPVSYDGFDCMLKQVTMLYNNQQVVFNLLEGTLSSSGYTYRGQGVATFTIDFTKNDTLQVHDVSLRVLTNTNRVKTLPSTFDTQLGKWVASETFSANEWGVPVNVIVDYQTDHTLRADGNEIVTSEKEAIEAFEAALRERAEVDSLNKLPVVLPNEQEFVRLDSLLQNMTEENDTLCQAEINEVLVSLLGETVAGEVDIDQLIANVDASLAKLEAESAKNDSSFQALLNLCYPQAAPGAAEAVKGDFQIVLPSAEGDKYISRQSIATVDTVALLAEGYGAVPMVDGSTMYVKHTDRGYIVIDVAQMKRIEVSRATVAQKAAFALGKGMMPLGLFEDLKDCINHFKDGISQIKELNKMPEAKDLKQLLLNAQQVCKAFDELVSALECVYNGIYAEAYQAVVDATDYLDVVLVAEKDYNQALLDDVKRGLKDSQEGLEAQLNVKQQNARKMARLKAELATASPEQAENIRKSMKALESDQAEIQKRINYYNKRIGELSPRFRQLSQKVEDLKLKIKNRQQLIKKVKATLNKLPKALNQVKQMKHFGKVNKVMKFTGKVIGTAVGAALQVIPFYLDVIEKVEEAQKWMEVAEAMLRKLPCKDNPQQAEALATRIQKSFQHYLGMYTSQVSANASSLLLDLTSNPAGAVGSIICDIYVEVTGVIVPKQGEKARKAYMKEIKALKCNANDPDDPDNDDEEDKKPNTPNLNPIIDPAGYVYEAVHSNRMEGVQASCYYKEVVEDMYGDKHENVVLWDAAAYAQKNPLFTDENGMYRWDVPQGLWQVKLEKEGYETTYSEWLPVPPPQLEVNLGMKQFSQPQVAKATAYPTGVEVVFDKYMDLETLEAKRFTLTRNGEVLNAQLEWVDAEPVKEGDALQYAKTVRLVTADTLLTTDEVMLTVSRFVKSYAGIPMANDFQQTFDIVKEVQQVVVDSLVKVLYGGEKKVRVSVLPFDAAIGQKVVVRSTSALIAATDTCEVVLDENGQAVFTLMGKLPGSAQLEFTLVEANKQAVAEVLVETELYMPDAPTASRASGTAVYRGTTVALETTEKDAVIYYTTDGSCPCDASHRKVYTDPIVIDDSMLIKAYVVTKDLDESEVASFAFSVKENAVGFDLQTGWNWISHSFADAMKPLNLVSEGVDRFVSQSAELVKDPQLGMTGQLSELVADQSYKVHMSVPAQLTHKQAAWNPSTPIKLAEGWNWMGYPLDQVMTVTEAFELTEKTELDYIVGQEGFAQYDGTRWVGTLQKLTPGKGYLYFTEQAKDLVYNTQIVSKAQSLCAPGLERNAPWAVDMHKYPNVMCIVADLLVDGVQAAPDTYVVGAFSGTECRGIGTYVDRKLMMNVYGNEAEPVNFRAFCVAEVREYDLLESTPFEQTMRGNVLQPYTLTLGELTNIGQAQGEVEWKLREAGDKLYIDGLDDVRQVAVYDATGRQVISLTGRTSLQGIALRQLLPGVHIVAVQAGTKYYYRKFVKH